MPRRTPVKLGTIEEITEQVKAITGKEERNHVDTWRDPEEMDGMGEPNKEWRYGIIQRSIKVNSNKFTYEAPFKAINEGIKNLYRNCEEKALKNIHVKKYMESYEELSGQDIFKAIYRENKNGNIDYLQSKLEKYDLIVTNKLIEISLNDFSPIQAEKFATCLKSACEIISSKYKVGECGYERTSISIISDGGENKKRGICYKKDHMWTTAMFIDEMPLHLLAPSKELVQELERALIKGTAERFV